MYRAHCAREGVDCKSQKNKGLALRHCLIKKHDSLNMTSSRTTKLDMLTWEEESAQPYKELQATRKF